MLDIVAALQWVRDNIDRFGGDPNLVTIFGQSGGGRKVATLMSMPVAKGLFHRAIIESGAVLRLTTPADAIHTTELLFAELGLKPGQVRAANHSDLAAARADATVSSKIALRTGHDSQFSMVDGKAIPSHPWDPAAQPVRRHSLLIGCADEETLSTGDAGDARAGRKPD
jgi:para-nitrobenzyl esterase